MLKTAVTRAVLAAAFVLAVISSVQAETELRWKFKEGQSLDYVMERGVEGKINLSGADIAFTLNMTFDTAWKVKSVAADGTAEVERTDHPHSGRHEFTPRRQNGLRFDQLGEAGGRSGMGSARTDRGWPVESIVYGQGFGEWHRQ